MEKEVTLSFNAAELLELAKQLTIAGVIIDDNYPGKELARRILGTVCATGHVEFNEHGDYEPGGFSENPFRINLDHDEDVMTCIEEFETWAMHNHISETLGSRDFHEKHTNMTPEKFFESNELRKEYDDFMNVYRWELMLNGVDNFRIVEMKKKVRSGKK